MAVAVVILAGWAGWSNTRSWCPVDIPVSLNEGSHFSSGEFASNLNAQYQIEISARGIPVETLECSLGIEHSCSEPSDLKVLWKLYSGEQIGQGSSDDTHGGSLVGSTGEVSRSIGYFRSEKGRRYRIDFDVLSNTNSLAAANPRLRISVGDPSYESSLVFGGLLRVICALVGITGAVLFALSVRGSKTRV